jgi:tRNA (adenine22-N1)-methyltransferase
MQENLPRLTARLALVASFVRRGVPVADIGTDHAYLPVWLVNSGFAPGAVASDVRKGPLDRAKLTARSYNVENNIIFLQTDGLDGVEPSQADDVVIAGMGGELIASIICRCGWLKNPQKHLVLQPMTAQEDLREYLCKNGFTIVKEAVAAEKHGSKLYLVMSVYYSGKKSEADPLYLIAGELPKNAGDNARAYLEFKAKALNKKAQGMSKSKNENAQESQKLKLLAENIMKICGDMQ